MTIQDQNRPDGLADETLDAIAGGYPRGNGGGTWGVVLSVTARAQDDGTLASDGTATGATAISSDGD